MNLIIRILCIFIIHKTKRKATRAYLLSKSQYYKDALKVLNKALNKKYIHYDLIISLGDRCQVSRQMRLNHLQFKSYPFDWLLNDNISNLQNLFKEDFNNFLDRDDLVITEKNETNLVVYNKRTQYKHLHDFEYDTIDKDYNIVKEKFLRRFERLKNHIENAKTVLFVYRDDKCSSADIIEFCNKLCEYYKNQSLTFYWLTYKKDEYKIKITQIDANVFHITCDLDAYHGKDKTRKWEGNEKLYKELFQTTALSYEGWLRELIKND